MPPTSVSLALIATTLLVIVLLVWATIHYVPLVLSGDESEEAHGSGGRPS